MKKSLHFLCIGIFAIAVLGCPQVNQEEIKEQVAKPIINHAGGEVMVGITNITVSANEGVEILYTLDGSDPSNGSKYTDSIDITLTNAGDSKTIKVVGRKDGYKNSEIVDITLTAKTTPIPMIMVVGTDTETFAMGYSKTPTKVDNFYMGAYEITQKQWIDVMGDWPEGVPSADLGESDSHPAYHISWYDAIEFCNKLSLQEGFTDSDLVYSITKDNASDQSTWIIEADMQKKGYRLPTQVEWEYAAGHGGWENDERNSANPRFTHAGVSITTDDGNDGVDDVTEADLKDYAWYNANNDINGHPNGTKAVGQKLPNPLGFFDMSGNVFEFCLDADTGSKLTPSLRGGCWDFGPSNGKVSEIIEGREPNRNDSHGFRIVRNIS